MLKVTQADIDAGMAAIEKMVADKVPFYERGAITTDLEQQIVSNLLAAVFDARNAAEQPSQDAAQDAAT